MGEILSKHSVQKGDLRPMHVGFFPITGDPIHYGHLNGAIAVVEALGLDSVYIQVCGDLPRHKTGKVAKHHRHQMARLAVGEFDPVLKYTPIGYGNELIGEENFILFANAPQFGDVQRFYYIAGADNEAVALKRFANNYGRIGRPHEVVVLGRKRFQTSGLCETVVYDGDFSSSFFRRHQKEDVAPKAVVEYCVENGLYGY